jgi:NADPH:quinone reductase-like Zn-dependent oxidoreductase
VSCAESSVDQVRAAFVEQLGPASEIRYGELPAPVPGPTDVLVDVLATAVNPVDTLIRAGAYRTDVPFPFVVGRDLVGRVAAPSQGFAAGELVWCDSLGHAGRQGAAAEQAVVPADRLYRLPDGVDPVEAVALLHPAATAYLAARHGRLRAGETVLVLGAAGNVGSALVTLAVETGARVVATASAADAGYCVELGAAAVFDYTDPVVPQRIREACPDGVDLYVDTAGRNDLATATDLLAHRGRIVLLAGWGTEPMLPVRDLYTKDGSIVGFVISRATVAELADAARTVNRLLTAGLRPRRVETLPLSAAADAHTRTERGTLHSTRLVLLPSMQ